MSSRLILTYHADLKRFLINLNELAHLLLFLIPDQVTQKIVGGNTGGIKIMRKVEYRCNHCMIVESKWLLNSDNRSSDYITCGKCGLESKKIGTEEVSRPNNIALNELERTKGNISKFL